MNPDADDLTWRDRLEIERIERFVDNLRIAPPSPGCGGKRVQPARSNHRGAERRWG